MLTQKVFMRKTKGGNVIKVVREHYLRDDIGCGSKKCEECADLQSAFVLEADLSISKKYIEPHYLVLDTNIILHQMDVIEEDTFCNVIILQTVLDEVKHCSTSLYKRLREIIADERRKFYVFVNEHHRDTFVHREKGETVNDRNDRAIRVATKWYIEHMANNDDKVDVILISDDNGNRECAAREGIPALSLEDYINALKEPKCLLDKLCRKDNTLMDDDKNIIFPSHLTPSEIHAGIKNGSLLQGSFQASRENFLEGFVSVEGMEKSILVQGRSGLNRSVDGDIVAIRLLPKEQWSAPSELVLQDDEQAVEENTPLDDLPKPKQTDESIPTGQVVGIIRRKWRQYCGVLQDTSLPGATRHIFVPAERKIPKIRIETRQAEHLCTQRIVVAIDSWPRHSRYPSGHFVRSLGKIGDKSTENEVLLLEHDVPHSQFSERVLSFLPKMPWSITERDVQCRTDLRHLDVCSVDPPGCTDIDDALHCRNLENGNYEVGVHIADVTHFIKPGTALDEEAAHRATTVYLVDKRIDMVPTLLSSNLCSLLGGEERLAFSCIWEISEDAEIRSTRFCKSIIRSRAALTYEQAQLIIDDRSQNTPIAKSLRGLNSLAKILKKKRIENGALVLSSPEIRFKVDDETLDPLEVEAKKLRETNSMVEEFMLLANISVAQKIYEHFPECAMLRRHPQPPVSNFEPLVKAATHLGFSVDISSGKELAKSLDAAVQPGNAYFNTMLRILATRCMMQAVYFASGSIPVDQFAHYGLATPIYTHFTSPIRRYADVIVHRLLAVCIGAESTYPALLDKKKMEACSHNLNYRNRMAQYAGRASVALNTHIFFRERVEDEDGYILYVRKNALQILIPKYGLEGTLYLAPPKGKTQSVAFTYNNEDHSQKCGDVVFYTFDPVVVQLSLDRSNVQREKLTLKLVKPEIPNFSVPSLSHKRKENVESQIMNKKSKK